MPRRRELPALLAGSIALLVVSCAHERQPRWPEDNSLVVAVENAAVTLDPRLGTDLGSDHCFDLLYSGLVAKDQRGNLVPDLAASWEVLDRGLRYRFHLRRGVRFHDGRPLTATDVVFTLGTVIDGSIASPKAGALTLVDGLRAIDPWTVDLTLKRPFGSLLVELTQALGIIPAGSSPEEIHRHPIGSGPFRFRERGPESVVFEAFEQYHGGRPLLDRVTLLTVPDATVRALELYKGTAQLVVNDLPPDLIPPLRAHPSFRIVEGPSANYAYLGFNLEDPTLRDLRVRRALALAIDRQALVDSLWRGLGAVTETMLPESLWAHHPNLPRLPYDPAAAERLLDEAGYPDPDGDGPEPRLRLSYKTSNAEIAVLQAQIIQQMAWRAGIALDIKSFEFATFYDDIRRGNFQIMSLLRTGVTDPNLYRYILHSASMPPAGQNRGRYRNARFDRLIDQAAELSDPLLRRPLYFEAQEILAEELPYVSLYIRKNVAVMAAPLGGYANYLGGELTSLRAMYWQRAAAAAVARSCSEAEPDTIFCG